MSTSSVRGTRIPVGIAAAANSGDAAATRRASGRQAWSLLWRSNRRLGVAVTVWSVLDAIMAPLVVGAFGVVVGEIPAAITHGIGSHAGTRLIVALLIAAAIYAFSLLLDPIGNALSTAASAQVTGALQHRLLHAVSGPVGVSHLEDGDVLDRLARATGSLSGSSRATPRSPGPAWSPAGSPG